MKIEKYEMENHRLILMLETETRQRKEKSSEIESLVKKLKSISDKTDKMKSS